MRKRVLQDHLRLGKKLIPPLLAHGKFQDVSWVDFMIPELIWIALLNKEYGKQKGAEITRLYIKSIKELFPDNKLTCYFLSSLERYNKVESVKLLNDLEKTGILSLLRSCYVNFVRIYPKSPLVILFSNQSFKDNYDKRYFAEFKDLLKILYDKTSVESTFTIGNLIYSLMVNDMLIVTEKSSMARLPELKDYPHTDISRLIASSCRATINVLFGDQTYQRNNIWVPYFWNRGIEIENCKI
jgi:hypothetical protein